MFFEKKHVSSDKTGLFSDLIVDFINHQENIKPFINSFPSLKSIKSSISDFNNENRKVLVSVLKEQYQKTCFSDNDLHKVKGNINKLLQHKSYTIVTGHQIHIFASPLFLIYKIISVISYANYLNKNLKKCHFVPCFWMATEDHDFQEINHLQLDDERYTWDLNHQNAIGNLTSKSVLKVLNRIEKKLKRTEFGTDLYRIYNSAYSNNYNYADATRSLLTSFFSEYGLVIIDANHKKLKKLFINHFQNEIINRITINSVSKTNQLIAKKYKPEINPLDFNIFYLSQSIRSKIQFGSENYFSIAHNKSWSRSELIDEINLHPERFSPNVFLRTIYQQHIMPNVLYVGGPSEISYWLQLKNLFHNFKVHYPILVLRSSFLILSKKNSKIQSKYALSDVELFLSHEQKIKKILKKTSSLKSEKLMEELNTILFEKEKELQKIKNFPINSFYVFQKKLHTALSKLESKVIKFEKIKHEVLINQLTDIDDNIFPNNSVQERVFSFIPFYINYGKSFFKLLIKESSLFDNKYIILNEKE